MIDLKLGILDGEHVELLGRQCGVPERLVQNANSSFCILDGVSRQLTEADLPSEIKALAAKSRRLAEGLAAAAPVPLALALEFCEAQATLAAKAHEILAPVLARRCETVEATIAAVQRQLTPAGKGVEPDLVAAGVEGFMPEVRRRVEGAAKVEALRAAVSILRSAADPGRARPRWLRQAVGEHEAERHKAAIG